MIGKGCMTTKPAKRSGERGAATLVEAAFTIPVLLLFMLGITDFSRALYAYHFVSDAAREATRFASVRSETCKMWSTACPPHASDIAAYVQTLEPAGLNFSATVSSTTACTNSSAAGCLSVQTTWPGPSGGWPSGCTTAKNVGCAVSVTVTYTYAFVLQSHFSIAKVAFPSTSEMVITQ
jgi:Flp pilus assembly protein TadG